MNATGFRYRCAVLTLIGFLSRNQLRFQHVPDAAFQAFQIWLVLFIFIVAFVNDLSTAIFAAPLNDRDTFDELVHVVDSVFLFHGVLLRLG